MLKKSLREIERSTLGYKKCFLVHKLTTNEIEAKRSPLKLSTHARVRDSVRKERERD